MALSGLTSAQSTNTENNAAYAQTWTWNSISTQTGLTISTTSPLTGGTLVNLSATAASATSTGKILSISNSTTGAGYGIYSAMTATGNTGLPIAGVNGGTNNQGAAIYGLNNSTSGWGEHQAGSSPNYFAGTVVVGAGAVVSLLNGIPLLQFNRGNGAIHEFGRMLLGHYAEHQLQFLEPRLFLKKAYP